MIMARSDFQILYFSRVNIYLYLLIIPNMLSVVSGQLSTRETLNTESFCEIHNVNLDCASGNVIVTQSIEYGYHVSCDAICCDYDSSHNIVDAGATHVETVARQCYGRTSCNVDLTDTPEFPSVGSQAPSYVTVFYQCIPESRITKICSSSSISSDGLPLYLASKDYPSVTTGSSTCSCSIEVYDCSSKINLYKQDVDLYSTTSNCEQRIDLTDGDGTTLDTIQCESYYGVTVSAITMETHYTNITFTDNSISNQEGLFLLAFEGSDSSVSFSLNCGAQAESWCIHCGTLPIIDNGTVSLDDPANSKYQAQATVTCDPGYETTKSKITCQANAKWETPSCQRKDCGALTTVADGTVSLDDPANSKYQAQATVTCDFGFETTKSRITCQADGTWETTSCQRKDDENNNNNDDDDDDNNNNNNDENDNTVLIAVLVPSLIVTVVIVGLVAFILYKKFYKTGGRVGTSTEEDGRNSANDRQTNHAGNGVANGGIPASIVDTQEHRNDADRLGDGMSRSKADPIDDNNPIDKIKPLPKIPKMKALYDHHENSLTSFPRSPNPSVRANLLPPLEKPSHSVGISTMAKDNKIS